MQYVVTNFAYGYGPFLRTTELARAVNDERVRNGLEPFGIIVPWVYGEHQQRIMREEFGESSTDIFLDARLGDILRSVFYADSSYEKALTAWVEGYEAASAAAREYLQGTLEVVPLSGEVKTISGSDVVMSLERAPRVSFAPLPSYSATFGHISEILQHTLEEPLEAITLDRTLVERAIPIARALEAEQRIIGLGTPSTFSYLPERVPLQNEVAIPPTLRSPRIDDTDMAPGIYVTITGIPGLERLFSEAKNLGLTLYTNDPSRLPGSVRATPDVIGNPAIKLSVARAGWGSIWGSQLVNKPIIVPPFDPYDDPEIYFNNRCVEALGLGIVFKNQMLAELIASTEALVPGIKARNQSILDAFGTLDGNAVIAKAIVQSEIS